MRPSNFNYCQVIHDFGKEYKKHSTLDSFENEHHNDFRMMPNRSYYEMPLTSMFPRAAMGMENIGLKSRNFDLESSINIIAHCARKMSINAKIQFYWLLNGALKNGRLTKEQFLKSICSVRLLVRDFRENEESYRLATQYLQVKEFDSGLSVVCKSVETICDGMTIVTKEQAYNPIYLSENINFEISTIDGEKFPQLSSRLKKMVLSQYFSPLAPPLFKGRAADVVDCYAIIKRKGINPTTDMIAEMLKLKYRTISSKFSDIKRDATPVIANIFPGCNMDAWEGGMVKNYLDTIYNVGLI